jgi:tetratricopeptide (TPR) repeat protein
MRRGARTAALACALLAACGSQPAKTKPPALSAALDANRRAEAQLRAGDLEGAARGYSQALRASQALEDADGIAANAVNLSIVYQRLGRLAEARASLAPVLEQPNLRFAPERLAQTALRRSLIDLDERRYASAAEWAGRAESQCDACPLSAAIHNVKGQLALESGRLDAAGAAAQRALDASRASGDRAETANALRLMGLVALRSGDGTAATARIGEALAIDRDLAASRKIYLDLVGLGRASVLLGERDAARGYYERALAVSRAERDTRGIAEASGLIKTLEQKPASQ